VQKNGVDFTSGTGVGFSFTPDDQGVYDVFMTAVDDDGGSLDASPVRINVFNVAPTALQLTNDGPHKVGETVTIAFQGVTDADADVQAGLTYDYDLDGNGSFETLGVGTSTITTTFGANGIYTVKGRIHDKDGAVSPIYTTDVYISDVIGGNGGIITQRYVVAGSDASIPGIVTPPSTVQVFNLDGSAASQTLLMPLGKKYTGGYRVAVGDVNGDHIEDVIVAPGVNGGRTLFIYDGAHLN